MNRDMPKTQTTTWKIREPAPQEAYTEFGEVHPMLVQLMWNRGIETSQGMEDFFGPDYDADVHDPFLFTRMQDVVERLVYALEHDQVIMIHGDYDADGICGTTVLWTALKEVCERGGFTAFEEQRVRWYLPNREGDGYGMSVNAVEQFKAEGVDVIVTVDCGIANVEETARAYDLGMEVIVVDHHQLPETCSDKAMIIHPLAPGETYPFKKLAAVGVAFKVACALYMHARDRGIDVPEGYEKWLLDLVAIATVTDMVPLLGENRTLETYGLVVLNRTKRTGLLALMDAAGLKQGDLSAMDIGFRIGPRINAAGRIAKADVALELLIESNPVKAASLAQQLNDINAERQKLTASSTKRALESVDESQPFIAVVDHEMRIGVAGLVAGKLAKELARPAVVMTQVGDHVVGSGRAPSGFHFVEAMDTCRHLMVGGGGHPEACGFTLVEERVEDWIAAMTTFADASKEQFSASKTLEIDAELALADINWELVEALNKMEPFGMGNPQPVFAIKGVQVIAAETVGKTSRHLRLSIATADRAVRQCIGFGWGHMAEALTMGDTIDLAFEVGINTWNGRREIQLQITDIQQH